MRRPRLRLPGGSSNHNHVGSQSPGQFQHTSYHILVLGVDDGIDIDDSSSLDITGELTVSAWINLESVSPGYKTIVSKSYSDTSINYAFGADVQPVAFVPENERRIFLGYKRADGQVGTRNYIAVISTVNCSAHAVREIARYFTPKRLASFPNVDGVIALTHSFGCPTRHVLLERTLAEWARVGSIEEHLAEDGSIRTAIAGMLRASLRYAQNNPLVRSLFQLDPTVVRFVGSSATVHRHVEEGRARMIHAIERAVERGELRDDLEPTRVADVARMLTMALFQLAVELDEARQALRRSEQSRDRLNQLIRRIDRATETGSDQH